MEIAWLGEPDCHDIDHVGGKAANISRLAANFRVPPGFCLTTAAYSMWATGSDGPSPSFYEQVTVSYEALGLKCGVSEPSVAVRSSSVDEDGVSASFAGQYDTYLNIVGIDAVTNAVQRCWASLRTDRAVDYRNQRGLTEEGVRLAVLVQQLVPADASGVVFSANPITGSRDEVMINSSWGLGESVVSGTVTPDTFVVRKSDQAILSSQVSAKEVMTTLSEGGTTETAVPFARQVAPSISHEQAVEVARLAISLESEMGWPVDAEFAFYEENLYLLQCRPITTL